MDALIHIDNMCDWCLARLGLVQNITSDGGMCKLDAVLSTGIT